MDISVEQIDLLVRKMRIAQCKPHLFGATYATLVRRLYLDGRLKLVSVADLRSFKRDDEEVDLKTPASICTYDELAQVSLNLDLTVTLYIRESTVSLRSEPSAPRANFILSGDWWAINKAGDGFSTVIEREFKRHCSAVFDLEEDERRKKRVLEIEAQLLAGTYPVTGG